MTPEEFIAKWRNSKRTEQQASQQHFLELCELLEVPKPGDPGHDPEDYDFEKRILKPGGTAGRADVWKKGCFAWEYKRDKKSLVAAYSQVKEYADALDNPPLLIVSDMSEIQIHTNFTNTPAVTHTIKLPDLTGVEARRDLRYAFLDPERLRPDATPESITTAAAASIGALATTLRSKGYEPRRVAHFLNKLVFCMFAEDIRLLPDYVFTEVMEGCAKNSDLFERMVGDLFRAMRDRDGLFGAIQIPWFNGGLFDDDDVLPLGFLEIKDVVFAAHLDWSAVEPSIFGTMFEKGLDPARRKEMASLFDAHADFIETSATRGLFDANTDKGVGVHYTDAEKIMLIVEPVILLPLRMEWEEVKRKITAQRAKKEKAKSDSARTRAENAARDIWFGFRERLGDYRVLDPACGSGNFLYLALRHLKDFDLEVIREGQEMGLPLDEQRITPEAVKGIEINAYAAELAQVTIWIGEIQWQLENGFGISRRPILGNLASIQCRDALINPDGTETEWPAADAIIGNPPFLGHGLMLGRLGDEYVDKIRAAYAGRVPGAADLVCYWFVKAGEQIRRGFANEFGLVGTNSIRGGANRTAITSAVNELAIFDAWSDEPWVINGAAVRVSLVCVCKNDDGGMIDTQLDGSRVEEIFTDLTARRSGLGVDLTRALKLYENARVCFEGIKKYGPFEIEGNLAREWLQLPANPNGSKNDEVLRPWLNGRDIVRRSSDRWVVDFTNSENETNAALFEIPYQHVLGLVKPSRVGDREKQTARIWWRFQRPRPALRKALEPLSRYFVTPVVSKHRIFVWLPINVLPSNLLDAFARDDDTTFGILHSQFHEFWTLRMCTWLGVGNDPRYTPSTTFETFPFPDGLTPNIPAADYAADPRAQAIAEAARELSELRENWRNPADLVKIVPEVVPGYPDRILPKGEASAKELKKRTLTNLYNARPTWLDNAHRKLDEAVAGAYGWAADLSDDEILKRLLELNLERAAAQEKA